MQENWEIYFAQKQIIATIRIVILFTSLPQCNAFFFQGQAPVVVMGATNRPKDVDRAILRRMPATFHIGLPSKEQRISIFRKILVMTFTALNFSNK